jgi:hypothetical protein
MVGENSEEAGVQELGYGFVRRVKVYDRVKAVVQCKIRFGDNTGDGVDYDLSIGEDINIGTGPGEESRL